MGIPHLHLVEGILPRVVKVALPLCISLCQALQPHYLLRHVVDHEVVETLRKHHVFLAVANDGVLVPVKSLNRLLRKPYGKITLVLLGGAFHVHPVA